MEVSLNTKLKVLKESLEDAFAQTTLFWTKEELAKALNYLDNILKKEAK